MTCTEQLEGLDEIDKMIEEVVAHVNKMEADARTMGDSLDFHVLSREFKVDGKLRKRLYLFDPKGRVVVGRNGTAGVTDVALYLDNYVRDLALTNSKKEAA